MVVAAGIALLAACGPTKFEVELNVPPPLVTKIPIVVGVYVPPEFANQVYEEKRRDYSISVSIGKAQNAGFLRLMDAMFQRAVRVNGTGPGRRPIPRFAASSSRCSRTTRSSRRATRTCRSTPSA
jgi:hypothetical protein